MQAYEIWSKRTILRGPLRKLGSSLILQELVRKLREGPLLCTGLPPTTQQQKQSAMDTDSINEKQLLLIIQGDGRAPRMASVMLSLDC